MQELGQYKISSNTPIPFDQFVGAVRVTLGDTTTRGKFSGYTARDENGVPVNYIFYDGLTLARPHALTDFRLTREGQDVLVTGAVLLSESAPNNIAKLVRAEIARINTSGKN